MLVGRCKEGNNGSVEDLECQKLNTTTKSDALKKPKNKRLSYWPQMEQFPHTTIRTIGNFHFDTSNEMLLRLYFKKIVLPENKTKP